MMTQITGKLWNADGTLANGSACVSWVAFTTHSVTIVGGQKIISIIEGDFAVDLYPNISAHPRGMYYTVRMELDTGAVYEEYWIVPDLPAATIEQVRSTFPLEPGMGINPSQIVGAGATPGMVLAWNGSYWEGSFIKVDSVSPNWIRALTGSAGNDFNIAGSPVSLGQELTINIPSASATARGLVTTGAQTFAGDKTFSGVAVTGAITGPTITDIYSQIGSVQAGAVPVARRVSTSTGLTGGGDLTADRTLSVVADSTTQKVEVALAGATIGTRKRLDFSNGAGISWSITDDGAGNRVTLAPSVVADSTTQRVRVSQAGTLSGTRQEINFIAGPNVILGISDSAGSNRVDVTITATPPGVTAAQTPWMQDIDANTKNLGNLTKIDFTDVVGTKLDLHGGNYKIEIQPAEVRVVYGHAGCKLAFGTTTNGTDFTQRAWIDDGGSFYGSWGNFGGNVTANAFLSSLGNDDTMALSHIHCSNDGYIRRMSRGAFAPKLNSWNSPHAEAVHLSRYLIWKNFSVNHILFDASQSTTPPQTSNQQERACNSTNSEIAWTATYPTLMGWNGLSTYGVRVDACRYSDSAGAANSVGWANVSGKPALCYNDGGTYGIHVTGNAGSASSVAWANVSGKPAICYNDGGTYSINVTGSAGSANSVAWGNVSGKPDVFIEGRTAISNFGGKVRMTRWTNTSDENAVILHVDNTNGQPNSTWGLIRVTIPSNDSTGVNTFFMVMANGVGERFKVMGNGQVYMWLNSALRAVIVDGNGFLKAV